MIFVLVFNIVKLRVNLGDVGDVDDMIKVYVIFVNRIIYEVCYGVKLQFIWDCMLDIFDLVIKVVDVQKVEMVRLEKEEYEIIRLLVIFFFYILLVKVKVKCVVVILKLKRRNDEDEDLDKEN